jgi:hypothetical protein
MPPSVGSLTFPFKEGRGKPAPTFFKNVGAPTFKVILEGLL